MKGYTVLNFENENDKEFKEYLVEVSFEFHYDPGRDYMPNGDPGYPGYETLEFVVDNEKEVPDWISDEMIEYELRERLPELLEEDEPEDWDDSYDR